MDLDAKERLESLQKMIQPGGYSPPPEWEAILAAHAACEKSSKPDPCPRSLSGSPVEKAERADGHGTASGGYNCSTCLTHFSTKQAYAGHFRNSGCKKRKHVVDLSGDSAPNGKDPAKNPARRKAPRTAAASAAANGSRDRGGARNVSRRRDDVPEEELGQDSGTHNADEDDVAQGEQTNGVRGLNDEENATVGARDTGARSVAGAGEDSEGLEGLRTGSDADQETGYRGAAEAEGSGGIGDLKGKAGEERIAEGDENLEGLEFAEEDLKTGASVLAKIMGKFTGQAAKMLVQEL